MSSFKPMLSANIDGDLTKVKYPCAVSPKLDGIRVTIVDGKALTRSLKPIPNKHVDALLSNPIFNGLDGEIIVGDPFDPMLYRKTMSAVMSEEGKPVFTFLVFDNYLCDAGFAERDALIAAEFYPAYISRLHQQLVTCEQELLAMEELFVGQGYEGIMLRSPDAKYKFGRSTVKEFGLVKWVRVVREEAVIVGFEERMHNTNEAKINALGHTERSSHKENLVGRGDLGSLIVKGKYEKEFSVGTGFTDVERAAFWDDREQLIGKTITYEFRPYGDYDVPRFPAFKGFRVKEDMSDE